jgi:membrane protease YdiL (CAAX protease family)
MYLTFSVLIGVESKNLEEFHIDKFTVVTFILGSILRRRIGIPTEGFFLILIALSGILVIFILISKKPSLPRTNRRWVFVGMVISVVAVIMITLLEVLFRNTWAVTPLFRNNLVATVIGEIVREFSFGALIEEILFRGFLWGYLIREGWSENKVIWTQGILFWALHLSRIVTPFTFFIVIPLITIIFSKLTLKSRQLFPAIVAHIIVNVISSMLNLATY